MGFPSKKRSVLKNSVQSELLVLATGLIQNYNMRRNCILGHYRPDLGPEVPRSLLSDSTNLSSFGRDTVV